MLKASEALAIAKKHDKYAEQLAQIDTLIRDEAERGGAWTMWYCKNMNDYEQKNFGKKIRRVWLFYQCE